MLTRAIRTTSCSPQWQRRCIACASAISPCRGGGYGVAPAARLVESEDASNIASIGRPDGSVSCLHLRAGALMRTWLVLFTRDLRVRDNPALHDAAESATAHPALRRRSRAGSATQSATVPCGVPRRPAYFVALARRRPLHTLRRPGGRGREACERVWRGKHRSGGGRQCLQPAAEARACRGVLDPSARATPVRQRDGRTGGGGPADRRRRPLPRLHPVLARLAALSPPDRGSFSAPYCRACRHRPRCAGLVERVILRGCGGRRGVRGGAAHGRMAPLGRQYSDHHNDLAADNTSRLSPYLHFGCISAITTLSIVDGPEEFVRQLCWRDFYHQLLAGFPDLGRQDYRPRVTENWRDDPDALAAWQAGQTGVPIVDAGMRQLAAEGFMHNRARLITASFLPSHSASTGALACSGTPDCYSTPTSPTTPATGNGLPAQAPTHGPIVIQPAPPS